AASSTSAPRAVLTRMAPGLGRAALSGCSNAGLIDHLVSAREKLVRHGKTEFPSRSKAKDELKTGLPQPSHGLLGNFVQQRRADARSRAVIGHVSSRTVSCRYFQKFQAATISRYSCWPPPRCPIRS